MALIEVDHLQKTYGTDDAQTPALRGVSFQIAAGEFVAIMGPSGSGKSTLLHILGFLDRPTGGSYRFDGRHADSFSDDELAQLRNQTMGFVFQAFNLLPRTTVLENVCLPLRYSQLPEREWRSRAERALTRVGLGHRLHHTPAQLSGGEQQRAAIARALVLDPKVLFADEPTGNLDSVSGRAVMLLLRELHAEQGHTIILITHETATAEHAERVLAFRDGRLERDERLAQSRRADQFTK
ncbi:ABC transporter ATP-binding protein [Candidatus Uhrbacteria bacterium]|nr:ABC transporter ATP-binding protein [Candidatus Uhrbacteria bacterium]